VSKSFGVLGLFDSAEALLEAIPGVKSKDLGRLEAYMPYPVHGVDEALGLRRSPLGGMVLVMGVLGATVAFLFQLWMSGVDYPLVTGGKSPTSWQAFVPIIFELTVLFAAVTAGLGMLLLLNRLPALDHPMLASAAIAKTTRAEFALAVEAEGGELNVEAAVEALMASGARSVEVLPVPEPPRLPSLKILLRAIGATVVACLVAGYATYWGIKLFPVLPPMKNMQEQPRLGVYQRSSFFEDGRGMRLPVEGTVARGFLPYPLATVDVAEVTGLANPLPRTSEVLAKGKQLFGETCVVCHGPLGDGESRLTSAYGAKPANLQARAIRECSDAQIFHTVTVGRNAMPSLAAQLDEEERWAVVHYVRALQRALNARDEDIP
jgi:mono/diheme cytochrome c family protein